MFFQDDDELKKQRRPILMQFFSPIFLKVVIPIHNLVPELREAHL